MNYKPGQVVYIKPLRQKGTIIKTLKSGKYEIQLLNMTTRAREEDLQLHIEKNSKKSKRKHKNIPLKPKKPIKAPALDLHGLKVQEALEVVEQKVNECIMKGIKELEIIHGIGGGKIKAAVYNYLEQLDVVSEVKPDAFNFGSVWIKLGWD